MIHLLHPPAVLAGAALASTTTTHGEAMTIPLWGAILQPLLTAGVVMGLMIWILHRNVFGVLDKHTAQIEGKDGIHQQIQAMREQAIRDESDDKIQSNSIDDIEKDIERIQTSLANVNERIQSIDHAQRFASSENLAVMQLMQKLETSHDRLINKIQEVERAYIQFRHDLEMIRKGGN